jgi:FMN phosphatase YigB (HAD superfamily)
MTVKVIFFDIGDTLVSKKKWLPEAKQTMASWRSAGLRVGLISNTGSLSRDELQNLLPTDFDYADFEEGLISSGIGIEKPALALFSLAVQHANVWPWETMFVVESLAESLAAHSAGILAARIGDSAVDYSALGKWVLANS